VVTRSSASHAPLLLLLLLLQFYLGFSSQGSG
jgi:hypothetical protein